MNRQERTEHFGPIPMHDEQGNAHQLTATQRLVRIQALDGKWSPWQVTREQLMFGRIPVKQEDDGSLRLATTGTLIRPANPPQP